MSKIRNTCVFPVYNFRRVRKYFSRTMNTETEMTSLTDTPKSDSRESQLKKPTHTPTNLERFCLDTWGFEILAWTFSVLCFVAICILLKVYESKVRPQLAYHLSLNAVISILATGCKSSLYLVVGEAVCQLKWLHFRGPRQQKLSSIQEFDNASRGPLGSICIILSHRAQSLVCLGATIIVILLAFEPFMQQVISYPVFSVKITDGQAVAKQFYGALVSPATLMNSTLAQAGQSSIDLSGDFANAWGQGLWSSDGFEVAPVCSSGNCTWEAFTSAGICSQCSDMTASAVLDCNLPTLNSSLNTTCQIKIPNGVPYNFFVTITFPGDPGLINFNFPQSILWRVYDNRNVDMNMSLALNVIFGGMRSPIAAYAYAKLNFSIPAHSSLVNSSLISIGKMTVCGLGDCLYNYNVSTSNGQASIQTGDPEFGVRYNKRLHNFTDPSSEWTYIPTSYDFTSCWIPDNRSKVGFAYCVPWFNSSLSLISGGDAEFLPVSDTQILAYLNGSSPGWGLVSDYLINRIEDLGFEKIISSVTASLTKLQLDKTKGNVRGTAYSSEVFVEVQWKWMILPGCLVLAGSLFFIATMAVNRKAKMPLWKSSAMVSLYHGLEKQEGDMLVTASSMQVKAENSQVRLMSSDGDGRLLIRRRSF
ncbi:hypothetical protein N7488_000991 [Penicillium malachiteum]|nr:hypothetical protein N7488_000991 [Penicillium malachiteum]